MAGAEEELAPPHFSSQLQPCPYAHRRIPFPATLSTDAVCNIVKSYETETCVLEELPWSL